MTRTFYRIAIGLYVMTTVGCAYEVEEMKDLVALDSKAKWTLRTWSEHSDCSLNLDGLVQLNFEDAKALGDWHPRYKSSKYEDALRIWIYKNPDWVKPFMNGFVPSVTPWCSPSLSLNGVTSISAQQATELARWNGTSLKLNGVQHLDHDQAMAFSKAPYIQHLYLDGATTVSDAALAQLANFGGTSLFLAGLDSMSTAGLTSLKSWQGDNLVLGIEQLTVEQARIIANMEADYIGLPNLKSPSDDVILTLLEKVKGHYLIGGQDELKVHQVTMLLHWNSRFQMRSSAVSLSQSNSIRDTILCEPSRVGSVECIDLSGPDFYMHDTMFMFATIF